VQGRGCHIADPWRVSPLSAAHRGAPFLLGGFRVRVGQPQDLPPTPGLPPCWVGPGLGWERPTKSRQ
jgi:hypothetical protein